jgi:hypothetical protein
MVNHGPLGRLPETFVREIAAGQVRSSIGPVVFRYVYNPVRLNLRSGFHIHLLHLLLLCLRDMQTLRSELSRPKEQACKGCIKWGKNHSQTLRCLDI